jgi:hypothetical protein
MCCTSGGIVDAESASDGVGGFVEDAIANYTVISNTSLDGVPALLSALETLTEIHPFLKGANEYFP